MERVHQITEGVGVAVEPFYQAGHSDPIAGNFIFLYKVSIENLSDVPVQLLRRHWLITDGDGSKREVEGEGVVGMMPVIKPGEVYRYHSACNLMTGLGRMGGRYYMKNLYNHQEFAVTIPAFLLVFPGLLN